MRIIYDVSRLATRTLNVTPNGIDWIDSLLGDHFLSDADNPSHSLLFGFRKPRLFLPGALPNPIPRLDRTWGRDANAPVPDWLAAALRSVSHRGGSNPLWSRSIRQTKRAANVAHSMRSYLFAAGADPSIAAPQDAIYLNAANFPLENPKHVAWLDRRRDVKPLIFVHDLLPVLQPHFFWRAEPARLHRRLAFLARRGAGAIVTSDIVASDLNKHLTGLGRADLPIWKAAPPVVPIFRKPVVMDPRLEELVYFVACGTIEPRKNHLLLIEVWRRLVARYGRKAPKLLVVGKRGWHYDQIVSAMHDPSLANAIIEANDLSTGAYRSALASARALLSPSFAEGFGLPVAEALAAGIPAIVSDVPSHREQGGEAPLYLDPLSVNHWFEAIDAYAAQGSREHQEARLRLAHHRPIQPSQYFQQFTQFMQNLE